MVKRNIITSLKIGTKEVELKVMEKVSESFVVIFCEKGPSTKVSSFLDASLKTISEKIGAVVLDVTVVVDEDLQPGAMVWQRSKKIFLPKGFVTSKDVENIVDLLKHESQTTSNAVTLVQPYNFTVFSNENRKVYDKAPVGKNGSHLEVQAAVTLMDTKVFTYVKKVISAKKLNLVQILLSSQEGSQRLISRPLLEQKSVLVNFDDHKVVVSLNENFCTLKNFYISGLGFNKLLAFVAKKSGCSRAEALKIFGVHGETNTSGVYVIHEDKASQRVFTNHHLEKIVQLYVSKLSFSIKKFIVQEDFGKVPVVVSGSITKFPKVEKWLREEWSNENVFTHWPLTFIEQQHRDFHPVGVYNFLKTIDKIYARQYNTIIETIPENVSSLLRTNPRGRLQTFLVKVLGGKNVWK